LINEKQTFVHTAPLTLVFVSNPVPPKDPSRPVNPERQHANNCLVAGTMLQSVALTAVSEGLGTCVRGSIDREAFAKAARLVPEQRVLISQTIGVPAK
jgi:nitroreductase